MKKFSDVENISWQPKPHKGTLGFIVDRLSPADLSLLKHREQFRFHEDARQQGSAAFFLSCCFPISSGGISGSLSAERISEIALLFKGCYVA